MTNGAVTASGPIDGLPLQGESMHYDFYWLLICKFIYSML